MKFSELKSGNIIYIHSGWGDEIQDDSIGVIVDLKRYDNIKMSYTMLHSNGFDNDFVWYDSDVDINETDQEMPGANLWTLIE